MQLLVILLVVEQGHLDLGGHLLTKVKLQRQIIFVDLMNVLDLLELLEAAEDLQELDLSHPLLIDLHLAAE
jgi:hypothetical protein